MTSSKKRPLTVSHKLEVSAMSHRNPAEASTVPSTVKAESSRSIIYPQDRSIDSRASVTSHGSDDGSKISTATPNHGYPTFATLPVTSPPFPLISPAVGRAGVRGVGVSNAKTADTHIHKTPQAKAEAEEYVSEAILSPPKFKTAAAYIAKPPTNRTTSTNTLLNDMENSTPSAGVRVGVGGENRRTRSRRSDSALHDIRKDIHELACQFAKMEKESQQKRVLFDLDAQDRFHESLDVMGQKADAMVDVLQRNYTAYSHLLRENEELKQQINTFKERKEHDCHFKVNSNDYNRTDERDIPHSSPIKLRNVNLDPSDDYVKRVYPPVPKTPGTMFATELVEVMSLEVGEHAYLAQVMDRQWNTTLDYRP